MTGVPLVYVNKKAFQLEEQKGRRSTVTNRIGGDNQSPIEI